MKQNIKELIAQLVEIEAEENGIELNLSREDLIKILKPVFQETDKGERRIKQFLKERNLTNEWIKYLEGKV